MKIRKRILVGVIFAAVCIALGIWTALALQFRPPEAKSHAVRNVAAVKDNLKLEMSLEKTQFTLGELVPITFVLTNESNQTLNFNDGTLQPFHFGLNFQVYNAATNNPVFAWLHGAYPISNNGTETLAPNENFTITLGWGQDSNISKSPGAPPPISPGEYYIIGDVGPDPPYKVQTPPLNITINNS